MGLKEVELNSKWLETLKAFSPGIQIKRREAWTERQKQKEKQREKKNTERSESEPAHVVNFPRSC